MDAYEAPNSKVQAIFRELVGERAEVLRGDRLSREANDRLGVALAGEYGDLGGDELAFHLIDWNASAAFLVALHLFPERFTDAELRAGVDLLLIDVPAHIVAAARLGGCPAVDIFNDTSDPG